MTTFKAQLIEDEGFYSVKRVITILSIVSGFFVGLFSSSVTNKVYYVIPLLVIVGIILYFQLRYKKQMDQKLGQRKILIDLKSIEIKGKDDQSLQKIEIDSRDHIIVKDTYQIPEETLRSSLNEMAGDPTKNYIILKKNGDEHRFEFLVDSHYMITQLNKLIHLWKEKGVSITSIS